MLKLGRVGQRHLRFSRGGVSGGLAPGDLVVGGGGAAAAVAEAALHAGVEKGEEPEDPRRADEEEGGDWVPGLRKRGGEDVENEENAAGDYEEAENGED